MRFANEFTITANPSRAYEVLIDIPRVAPCVPGARVEPVTEDGSYPGSVSIRLGPMKLSYTGTVRVIEDDPLGRRATIEGRGRSANGADTAIMRTSIHVVAAEVGSTVVITTDLDLRGPAALIGRGLIDDVSKRLIADAARCIEAQVSSGDIQSDDAGPVNPAQPVRGEALMAAVIRTRLRASIRNMTRRPSADVAPPSRDVDAAD